MFQRFIEGFSAVEYYFKAGDSKSIKLRNGFKKETRKDTHAPSQFSLTVAENRINDDECESI